MATTRQAKGRSEQLKLLLLGSAELRRGNAVLRFARRKTLALLVYLALEPGPHSREKLAALLWPDSDQGRTNLRSTVAELKAELGHGLWAERDSVELDLSSLQLDLSMAERAIQTAAQENELKAALKLFRGDLLEGFDLIDAPDFDDWLLAEREVVRGWWDALLERLGQMQSGAGRTAAALASAQQRLRLEALNEAAHRQVIEIYLASGNRSAAMEAFSHCREVLQRELGLEPDPQTQALLRRFGSSAIPVRAATAVAVALESRLVGREREWSLMEAAWQAGQAILLHGTPGVGKSRLMLEFAASRGQYLHCSGRPGDTLVPYGTHARTFKQITDTFGPSEIPGWVRYELSRIIPELGQHPQPINSNEDKLRFFEAKAEILRLYFARGCAVMAFDDVQFVDEASLDAGFYALLKFLPTRPGLPRSIHCYRTEELSSTGRALIGQAVDSGLAALIEVKPLKPTALGELLTEIGISDGLTESMHRFTGGNPLFVLETVRTLSQRGGLESLTAERFENRRRLSGLPPSPRVQAIIERRLATLSPEARELAQVAALMGEYFGLDQGAKVLQKSQLEVVQAAEELEVAQVWHNQRFSHDLVFEGVLEGTSASLKTALHGRVLEVLETTPVPAAVLVEHAIRANAPQKVLAYGQKALSAAVQLFANQEIFSLLRQAVALLEQRGLSNQAADMLSELGIAILHMGYTDDALQVLETASHLQQELGNWQGVANLQLHLSESFRAMGDYLRAQGLAQLALERFQFLEDPKGIAAASSYLGEASWWSRNFVQAEQHYSRAYKIARDTGDKVGEAWMLKNLGQTAYFKGEIDNAKQMLEDSLQIQLQLTDKTDLGWSHFDLGRLLLVLGQYARAAEYYQSSLKVFRQVGQKSGTVMATVELAHLEALTGSLERAEQIFSAQAHTVLQMREADLLYDFLSGYASLQYQRGRVGEAAEIVYMIVLQAKGNPFTEVRAQQLLSQLETELSPHQLEQANQRAQTLSPQEVVKGAQ